MKLFEYYVLHCENPSSSINVEKSLNDMGKEGWEFVTTYQTIFKSELFLIFKREINFAIGGYA